MSNDADLYREPMVIIRQKFLVLTDNEPCSASLLDRFNAFVETGREYSWFRAQDNEPLYSDRETFTVEHLTKLQCGVFSAEEVVDGLNHLIEKEYIVAENEINGLYQFWVNKSKIDKDVSNYYDRIKNRDNNGSNEEIAEQETLGPIQDKPEIEEVTTELPKRNESRRVNYHNRRASRVGLPASLTTKQWTKTLEHFNWKCALCSDGAYEVLEHFVPLICGGGTTEYNCIPACVSCNRIKNDTHPSIIPTGSRIYQSIQKVQEYLESRRVNAEEAGE